MNAHAAFDFAALGALLPIAFRVVTHDLNVVYTSGAYEREFNVAVHGCCEQLGLRHHDADCPSLATIRNSEPQTRDRWLGRIYARITTVPLRDAAGRAIASIEWISDNSIAKKLEAAFARQADLLETINKAMIDSNHNLESAQAELEVKNQSLEEVNNKLIELDRQKDDFVSIVSHELKAPLTSIKGSVDLILQQPGDALPPQTRELLTICQRNTGRLHRLIMDMLDIARIESGMMSFQMAPFEVGSWLEECAGNVRALAGAKGLELSCRTSGAATIVGDRDRLLQVIVNLANNAVKFTESGRIEIEMDASPERFICTVRDTGVGIPEHALQNIFDKFSQVKVGARRDTMGTGLGLAIARAIIAEHGGAIHVASRPGAGSTFTCSVPQPPTCSLKHAAGSIS
ncbi:HAMP domain-containing histidine kinase [candidate division KSB1 bacterium]|nr:HAMP domain-containing histidine kinase [candidate division KSB1 bacterium]